MEAAHDDERWNPLVTPAPCIEQGPALPFAQHKSGRENACTQTRHTGPRGHNIRDTEPHDKQLPGTHTALTT